ncbi:putative MFS family arabinose efflux permease [Actinocorallia herbida]|uniref:Putative MFS family arabinose efflux permease n=1 Tax=Actinocorallia herbida TaxID=58109 RepID=A0A3N1D659_9ACTN|nr:MFS transporter [Actinocorallia herbida]ROO89014.1 putative MFS family arabinose efflux permease [Actinocorallia herbida]
MTTTRSGRAWTSQLSAYRAAVQRRVLLVLTAVQVVAGIGAAAGAAAGTLAVRHLSGSDTVAGFAQVGVLLGAALAAVPVARLAASRGRRPALAFGYGCGLLGALVAAGAVAAGSWRLLLAGLVLLGGATAAGLAARFAATDLSRPGHPARDLSIVVWAATGGSVAGPLIAGQVDDTGSHLGVYALTAVVFAMAAVGIVAGLRPDPLQVAHEGSARGAIAPERSLRSALGVLGRSPSARVSVMAIAVSHTASLALLAATSLQLDRGGADAADLGIVLSLHVAGMYVLSPLIGWCADQLGHVPVLLGGQVLLVLAALTAGLAAPGAVAQSGAALVLLGVGWSCGLVAGSALLTESVPVDLRPSVQGLSDLLMNAGAAVGVLVAGLLVTADAYTVLPGTLLVLALPMATALLLARRIAPAAQSTQSMRSMRSMPPAPAPPAPAPPTGTLPPAWPPPSGSSGHLLT